MSKEEADESARKRMRLVDGEESGSNRKCPYLNTVNRAALDFDMAKVCGVTLTKQNVYCCLVCGHFFQGRGAQTPCYTHSVQAGHFVFIHLQTTKTYCLPDGYEILDSSLNDIKYCLQPTFSAKEIEAVDSNKVLSRDIHGAAYLPGFIGLNSVISADCINPVLHTLSHIQPVRDFFLQTENLQGQTKPLLLRFGELVRKMWSPGNFKSVLSPQELVHEIVTYSKKRLSLDASTECIDLWNWLVGELNSGIMGMSGGGAAGSASSSVISDCTTGVVEVTETKLESTDPTTTAIKKRVNFKYLSLAVPAPPLFRDSDGALVIPQLPIFDLLRKFDGETAVEEHGVRKTYRIRRLPQFLLINLDRKGRNKGAFTSEGSDRNSTIVTFPAKNLEMRNYFFPDNHEIGTKGSKYDLVASISLRSGDATTDQFISLGTQSGHSAQTQSVAAESASSAARAKYVVHLRNKATDQWYALDDLVVTEVLPHQIALSEAHVLLYEQQQQQQQQLSNNR